ncbi:MAG: hypothetical protein A2840_01175 [Candidatus Buchananbacteria bacterium RIFCSPHIGHO2_01_FULL_47_11b]|uniref:Nudix hydrolase domain-containing protein n=1 Tax=Candidatus Buchananbacteria bacterium RIFCSPHIGHO2_01_FULL_47_11b TaxID=1797537 RepID=A0A1G1Y712_9BACT|nr:MAG: hypothetical protein A2840_01175 [Candidatus Buchananbacteria bacterium RIFCSPHIGHO2_01_FULL_47_11b]
MIGGQGSVQPNVAISAGGVIVHQKRLQIALVSKISLTKPKLGKRWSFPKGRVDEDEDSAGAAMREIFEEIGIPPKSLTLLQDLGSYLKPKVGPDGRDLPEKKRIHLFVFSTDHDGLESQEPGKHPDTLWVNSATVHQLLSHELDRSFFITVVWPALIKLFPAIARPE